MKKFILLVLGIIIIAVVLLFGLRGLSGEDSWICQNGQWIKHGYPSAPQPTTGCGAEIQTISGEVIYTALSAKVYKIQDTSGKEINIAWVSDTKFTDQTGTNLTLPEVEKGFSIQASGSMSGNNLNATEIILTKAPNIVVFAPASGDEIGLPVKVTGVARVFENQFRIRIKDNSGKIIADVSAYANSPDVGKFGQFEENVNYTKPTTSSGVIEVFDNSAKDDSEIDKISIPVKFKSVETMTVNVYFSNSTKDPNTQYCNKTYATPRTIAKTESPARAALEELLKGPTVSETKAGNSTSINKGVKIQQLTIVNGVAKVDFDETLERSVGGSCRVAAIRSQITNTLKQFPTVKSVIISINGRTEDILQP